MVLPNTLILTLIGIVIAYIILLYLLSRLNNNEEWKNNYRIEVQQLLLSVLLFIGIHAIAGVVNLIYSSYTQGFDLFDYISIQLINMLKNLHEFAAHLTLTGTLMKMFGEFTNIGYPHGNFGSARLVAYPGVDLLSSVTFQIRDLMFIATGGLVVQSIIMDLIKTLALTLVLPIGIVLRILPTFRQFGNELIGLSVSLYIIMPLIYAVFFQTMIDLASYRGGFIERFSAYYLMLSESDPTMIAPDKMFVEVQKNSSINNTANAIMNDADNKYFSDINSELEGTTSNPDSLYRMFELYMSTSLVKAGYVLGLPLPFLFVFGLYIYAAGFLVFAFGLPGFALAITLTAAKSIRDSLERLV